MATVLQLLDEQFGRILLAVALVWAVLVSTSNGPLVLDAISQKDLVREVQVSLNAAKLPAAALSASHRVGADTRFVCTGLRASAVGASTPASRTKASPA